MQKRRPPRSNRYWARWFYGVGSVLAAGGVAWIVIGVFVHSWEGFLGAAWLFLAAGQLYYARQFRRRDRLGQAPPGADEDMAVLVRQGRKIEAIKRYRQLNPGIGLIEAKQVIDGLPTGLNEPERS